jgi:hypothetical protein
MSTAIILKNNTTAQDILKHPLCPFHPFKSLLFTGLLFFYQYALADTGISISWLGAHLNHAQLTLVDMIDDIQYQRFHVPSALHFRCPPLNTTDRFGVSYSSGAD